MKIVFSDQNKNRSQAEQAEYYHNRGLMPDWIYYQLNGKSAEENLAEQRNKIYQSYRAEQERRQQKEQEKREEAAALKELEKQIEKQAEIAIEKALDDVLKDFLK